MVLVLKDFLHIIQTHWSGPDKTDFLEKYFRLLEAFSLQWSWWPGLNWLRKCREASTLDTLEEDVCWTLFILQKGSGTGHIRDWSLSQCWYVSVPTCPQDLKLYLFLCLQGKHPQLLPEYFLLATLLSLSLSDLIQVLRASFRTLRLPADFVQPISF